MKPLTHEESLKLVCAVCTNLNGYKAKRTVSEADAALIKRHVFRGYQKDSIWFPQGICVRCSCDIRILAKQVQEEEASTGTGEVEAGGAVVEISSGGGDVEGVDVAGDVEGAGGAVDEIRSGGGDVEGADGAVGEIGSGEGDVQGAGGAVNEFGSGGGDETGVAGGGDVEAGICGKDLEVIAARGEDEVGGSVDGIGYGEGDVETGGAGVVVMEAGRRDLVVGAGRVEEGAGGGKKKKVVLKLPEDYICDLPTQTRSKAAMSCSCKWCSLARLSGPQFKLWKLGLKKKTKPSITFICKDCGKGVPSTVKSHSCHVSDLERVMALVHSIPKEVRSKLALALINEQQEDPTDNTVYLPQPRGGKMVQVTVGKLPAIPELNSLTIKEAQVMSSKAHLTGEQQKSVLADLRSKFGQKVVEPGMKLALPIHNKKFAEYFTVEKRSFMDSDGHLQEKNLFYCHSPVQFLKEVDRQRGREGVVQATIVQGDSGQGYTKIAVSRIDMKELEKESCTRIPGAGVDYLEEEEQGGTNRKRRRTREEGIEEGEQFQDWGARKLFILAVVYKVQENAYNLETIFKAIKLEELNYRLTGDFAFFMPSLGFDLKYKGITLKDTVLWPSITMGWTKR